MIRIGHKENKSAQVERGYDHLINLDNMSLVTQTAKVSVEQNMRTHLSAYILWRYCHFALLLSRYFYSPWLKLACKGICKRHKALKPSVAYGGGRYSAGQKRCAVCELFMKWDGWWCPCCGCRLGAKPRTVERRRKWGDLCAPRLSCVSIKGCNVEDDQLSLSFDDSTSIKV